MGQIFQPNLDPRYYGSPGVFQAKIGAAAITSFPVASSVGVQASGTWTFGSNPAAGNSVTVNGVTATFAAAPSGYSLRNALLATTLVDSRGVPLQFQGVGPTGLQVQVGATTQESIANLLGLLGSWPDQNLRAVYFTVSGGNVVTVKAATTGTAGNSLALAASGPTASGATLSGGSAPTSGIAILVEPQLGTVEIQQCWGICEATQAAGTVTLFQSDGTTAWKRDAQTYASGATLSATQELGRLVFVNIAAATPLQVLPGSALAAYGGTTQVVDITGIGGIY